jgi:DNA repair exonuclease SbcCD ATPase subunit
MSDSNDKAKGLFETLLARDLWKALVAGAATLVTVSGIAFNVGLRYAESQSNVRIADLNSSVGQAQAKLETAQGKIDRLSDANGKLKQSNGQLLEELKSRNGKVEQLSARLGSENNCAFIQDQIRSLDSELNSLDASFASEEMRQARQEPLEQRLARYQAQLSSCSCK